MIVKTTDALKSLLNIDNCKWTSGILIICFRSTLGNSTRQFKKKSTFKNASAHILYIKDANKFYNFIDNIIHIFVT